MSVLTCGKMRVTPVNVFLRLSDGLDGTLEFTQICSLLPEAAAVFVFVPWKKDDAIINSQVLSQIKCDVLEELCDVLSLPDESWRSGSGDEQPLSGLLGLSVLCFRFGPVT